MDDNKRRAFIRKQVTKRAKKHLEGVVPLTRETTQMKPFIKRKLMDKGDRPPKKPMEVVVTTVGEKPVATQVPLPCYGISKGLMTTKGPILEQPPPLLREDPWHVVGFLLSIIKDNDYEDLGNHATEAMGESGLFGLAQERNHPPCIPFFDYRS